MTFETTAHLLIALTASEVAAELGPAYWRETETQRGGNTETELPEKKCGTLL